MLQTRRALSALRVSHFGDCRIQILLLGDMFLDCGLEHNHLILEWLHIHFDGVEMMQDSVKH
jgi:hypothetical protein